jgi:hypothetical protein
MPRRDYAAGDRAIRHNAAAPVYRRNRSRTADLAGAIAAAGWVVLLAGGCGRRPEGSAAARSSASPAGPAASPSAPPAPPPVAESPAPFDESAARDRLRVLLSAAESGSDADVDALAAFLESSLRDHPGTALARHIRRDLPAALKTRALRAERRGNGRRALVLYRIYERLTFLPPDREVARRRRALEAAFAAARENPAASTLEHSAVLFAPARRTLRIHARWPGADAAVSGEVHYRNRLSPDWRSAPLVPDGNALRADIPAGDVVAPTLSYWIEARNGAGRKRRAGSADLPFVVHVFRR